MFDNTLYTISIVMTMWWTTKCLHKNMPCMKSIKEDDNRSQPGSKSSGNNWILWCMKISSAAVGSASCVWFDRHIWCIASHLKVWILMILTQWIITIWINEMIEWHITNGHIKCSDVWPASPLTLQLAGRSYTSACKWWWAMSCCSCPWTRNIAPKNTSNVQR